MPGATVIDQLIVKLGLDPREFTKGQKQAAQSVVATEQQVKRSSQGMSGQLLGVSKRLLGIASAAVAIRKSVTYVSDLSKEVRQLGIDSRNFGIAANELRNFQNIAEMEGGKTEEATRTIGNLMKAVYDLAYNGTISDSLVMLGRLGVQFQTTTGEAREFRDIVLDTEKAIQARLASGSLSRVNANQMLLQAGFDPGLAQAILNGTVGSQLAQQGARRQATGDIVDAATKWEKSATNRDQAVSSATLRTLPNAAEVGSAINDKIAAGAEALSDATLEGGIDAVTEALTKGAEKIAAAADEFVGSVSDLAGDAWRAMFPKGREHYERTIQEAAKKNGLDPEFLAGVLQTESNFDPSAKNASGAVGIAQLMPKYFPKAGRNPHNDINDAARELKRLQDAFMKDGNDLAASQYLALQGYNAGRQRVLDSMGPDGKPLAKETQDYPGKVLDYANRAVPTPNAQGGAGSGSTSNSTEVNIGRVDVVTQATDADGIARDFAGATRRKLNAAQADRGMN